MKIQMETVHGEPIAVEGHRIEPMTRRVVGVWRKATVGAEISGTGGAVVRLQPVGVRVGEGPEARFVPVHDQTRQILWIMLAAAIVVPLLLTIAERMTRR